MLSLKQISKLLQDKKENHVQLSSGTYFFGDPWNFGMHNEITYPFMGARLLPSGNSINNTQNGADSVTSIEVFFCDLIHKDNSDYEQVLSDMQIVALDIYSQLLWDLKNYYKVNLDPSVSLNPFTDRFNDEVTGWSIVINIRQFYDKSTCDNVSSGNAGKVIIQDQDGNVIDVLDPNTTYTVTIVSAIDGGNATTVFTNTVIGN